MLHMDFSISPEVQAALEVAGNSHLTNIVVPIKIEREFLRLLAPPIGTPGISLNEVLEDTQRHPKLCTAPAVLLVVRQAPDRFFLVVYVSRYTPPQNRILYPAGIPCLRQALPHAQKQTIRITSWSELNPSLFEAKQKEDNTDLMTESERTRAVIATMQVAPPPTMMPGVAVNTDAAADEAFKRYARGELDVVTFKVEAGKLLLDRVLEPDGGDLERVKRVLPATDPRFVLMRRSSHPSQPQACMMVYVCPLTCSARVRFGYASAAAAFREVARVHGIHFTHKVETDSPDTLVSDVQSACEHPGL